MGSSLAVELGQVSGFWLSSGHLGSHRNKQVTVQKDWLPSAHGSEVPQTLGSFSTWGSQIRQDTATGLLIWYPQLFLSQEPIFTFMDEGTGRGKKREMGR